MGKAKLTIAIGGEYTGASAMRKAEADLKSLRTEARNMGGVTSDVMKLGDSFVDLGSSMEVQGAKISDFGTKLTKLTAPIAVVGAACVKLASDYEDAVAKVYTIMDKSAMSTESMSQTILDLSTKTGKSATELADATYQALSASVSTEKVAGFVENAVKLAKTGFTETATAVDTLTTVINAYGYSADDAQMISDKLVQTQNKGKTTVNELATSIGNVIPTASAYNVSLDNLCSAYVIMTKQGINTANSTTAINGMLTELADSGSEVAQILQNQTGKSFGQLMADGADLGEVIQILSDYVDGDSEAFANLWGNVRASKGALAIANAGASAFTETMGDMAESTGLCDQALEDLQTPSAKAGKALNAVKNTGIQLGEEILSALVPSIEKLSDMAQGLYNWFKNLDEGTKQNIVTFGGLAVAVGPVVTIIGKLYSGVGSLITHLGKGLQSVGAFSAAMKTAETEMKTAGATTVSFGDKVKNAAEKTGKLTSATNLLKGGLAMLGIGAAVALIGALVGKLMEWHEHTVKVENATKGLEEAAKKGTAAYEAYTPAIEGSTKALDLNGISAAEAIESQSKLADTMNDTWKNVNTDAAMVDYYAGVLADLGNKGSLTETEFSKLQVAVSEYNRLTGSSVEITNDMTGELNTSTEAILNHAEAYKEEARQAAARDLLIETNKQLITDELALEDANKKLKKAQEEYDRAVEEFPDSANYYLQALNDAERDVKELEDSVKSNKKAQEDLCGVLSETPNYFKTMEDALSSAGLSMEDLGDITDEQLSIMQQNFDGTLQSIYDTCVEQGWEIPEGLKRGIESNQGSATASAEELVRSIDERMRRFLGISSPSRRAQEIGEQIDAGLINGINGNSGNVYTAAQNASVSARNGLGSVSTTTTGHNFTVGFINGLYSLSTAQYGQNVAVSARNGLNSVGTETTGHNFTVGFVNGMNGVDLYSYAWNLANRAVSAVKNCLGISSPSKVAQEMGRYFGEGAVIGMQDTEDAISAEAERMSALMGLNPDQSRYGAQLGAYGQGASPGYVNMEVTVNVYASSAEQAKGIGTSLADGLYEQVSRRMNGELTMGNSLWDASYTAA